MDRCHNARHVHRSPARGRRHHRRPGPGDRHRPAASLAGRPAGGGSAGQPDPSGRHRDARSRPPISSADALAIFAQIEEQVSDLRDLPAPDIGPPDVITRDELAVELEALFDETWTDEQLAADNLTLRAMGLLTADQDIRELTEQLYAGQVLGFYDFEDQRMVVVTDAGLTAEAQITYAHEFTHAMQDAAFDTGAARDATAEDDDAALARLALEEGDATVAMFQWAFGNLAPDQLGGIGATPLPDMSGIPEWMVQQLEFPYLAGSTWVSGLWASGGWDAVNAAYDQPPASTEQVLHPEKYVADERPADVPDPDVATADGRADGRRSSRARWARRCWASGWAHGRRRNRTRTVAAAGWGGDRLSVASGPNDEWGMAWRIAWDTTAQADEFDEAYGADHRGPAVRDAGDQRSRTGTR